MPRRSYFAYASKVGTVEALTTIAANLDCIYSGQPSWRRLVLLIAPGEITFTVAETGEQEQPKKPR